MWSITIIFFAVKKNIKHTTLIINVNHFSFQTENLLYYKTVLFTNNDWHLVCSKLNDIIIFFIICLLTKNTVFNLYWLACTQDVVIFSSKFLILNPVVLINTYFTGFTMFWMPKTVLMCENWGLRKLYFHQ